MLTVVGHLAGLVTRPWDSSSQYGAYWKKVKCRFIKQKIFCILRKIELKWNNFHEYSCLPYLIEDEACVLMNQGQHKVKASIATVGSQRGRNTLIESNLRFTQHVLLTEKLISQHGTNLANYCSYPLKYIYELENTRGTCYTFDLSAKCVS